MLDNSRTNKFDMVLLSSKGIKNREKSFSALDRTRAIAMGSFLRLYVNIIREVRDESFFLVQKEVLNGSMLIDF